METEGKCRNCFPCNILRTPWENGKYFSRYVCFITIVTFAFPLMLMTWTDEWREEPYNLSRSLTAFLSYAIVLAAIVVLNVIFYFASCPRKDSFVRQTMDNMPVVCCCLWILPIMAVVIGFAHGWYQVWYSALPYVYENNILILELFALGLATFLAVIVGVAILIGLYRCTIERFCEAAERIEQEQRDAGAAAAAIDAATTRQNMINSIAILPPAPPHPPTHLPTHSPPHLPPHLPTHHPLPLVSLPTSLPSTTVSTGYNRRRDDVDLSDVIEISVNG